MAKARKKKATKKVVEDIEKIVVKKVVKPKEPTKTTHKDLLELLNKAVEVTDDIKEQVRLGNRIEFGNRILKTGSDLRVIIRNFR